MSVDDSVTSVEQLLRHAGENEKILRRYQQFELELLNVEDFQSLLNVLLQNSIKHFQWDAVELWLFDPQSTLQELLCDEVFPGLQLLASNNVLRDLYDGRPQVSLLSINNEQAAKLFPSQHTVIASAALLPLIRQRTLVGSLHFGASTRHRFANSKATDFIEHLASVVSVCFENTVNRERLHRLSMLDGLTQIKNRRAFQLALDAEVSRSARSGDPLSLLFVDLDHFKNINDQFGHQVGDRLLKAVAQHIEHMLRKTDHVCRYGGEEFALVLPNCGRQRAEEIAERIRLQVSELHVDNDQGGEVSVTLSMGISGWLPKPGDTELHKAETLIACSDKGVYQSKADGRNRIHYVDLTSSPNR